MGIPVRRYVTGVFIYGSVLAGIGGALMIALYPDHALHRQRGHHAWLRGRAHRRAWQCAAARSLPD